ncbi:MAG: hypothetical protein R2726_20300 [Acidimicrobiales bacterium]
MTRRDVLAGAGGLAGAAVLHVAGVDPAGADSLDPDLPGPLRATAEAPGGPPLAVVPGLQFKSWGGTAFQPVSPSDGRVVTSTGTYTNLDDGYLTADLDLPWGAQLLSAQVCATNTSGVTRTVYIEALPLTGGSVNAFGLISVPNGTGLQTVFGSMNHRIDPTASSYDATLYTYATGTFRIRSLRLGFQPNDQAFVPMTPTRIYDSRPGNPPLNVTKGPLSNGTRVIDCLTGMLPGLGPLPRGVLVNLTVVNTSASGFLALYQNGISFPNTSSVNWFAPNEIVANTTYTAIDTSGQAVALVPASSSTDFFIDRVGLYL